MDKELQWNISDNKDTTAFILRVRRPRIVGVYGDFSRVTIYNVLKIFQISAYKPSLSLQERVQQNKSGFCLYTGYLAQ